MIPVRRNLHFRLKPGSVLDWHRQGLYVTHFINAMSIIFPCGERFFIDSVRHYRDRISNPELQKAVTAFVGQEAMHGREHDEHNQLLSQAGLPAQELEGHVNRLLSLVRTELPPAAQLSITIAMEHFTAIMANLVLTDPRILAGADRHLTALWRWHALEETEHKSVAFDVYQAAVGKGADAYALRVGGQIVTTLGFLTLVLGFQQQLLRADSSDRRGEELRQFLRFMFISPAFMPRLTLPWLDYFRTGFHPWDKDNRYLLDELQELVKTSSQPEAVAA